MNVELRHLRALAAIGDHRSITAAAQALHVTQPALSRTLDQFERRLGVRLVERTTRHVALTEPGQRLWEHSHRILTSLDSALAEAVRPQPLRLTFAWAALGEYTIPFLREWRAEHPDVLVHIRRSDDPEAALRRGEADVAVLRTEPADADIDHVALLEEPRVAAVADDHPLATRDALLLADLTGECVAVCETAATTGADLWPSGARPRTVDVPGVVEWLTSIATGATVGVTAAGSSHHNPHPGVTYLPLADAEPITVRLAWPSPAAHPSTEEFIALARRHLAATAEAEASPRTARPDR
ncbi:DNA-binding transcriptional regulator, LysR family [Lentzea waywayandensis]|uniref:DNA-binding transcriptional regulator, LysR family n=1 Tax=Lentzea waywayandensis TaxID=84724 RepID=A0A1I6F839_9PSEU|nr:LysR family transcriptional regulator [Lentzea waywayandensis]SFR26118.1 DNA-binding transcriptional regulator, LysR family [Lentzea waywayandensis]